MRTVAAEVLAVREEPLVEGEPTVLGVDSSTQSTKVELREASDGRLLAHGRAPHPTTRPPRTLREESSTRWDALARMGFGRDPLIVDRRELKGTIARVLRFMTPPAPPAGHLTREILRVVTQHVGAPAEG